MIKWRQKLKPQKIPRVSTKTPKTPMPNFQAIKIFRGTTQPGYAETITNLQIVLNTQKSLLKSSYPKNTCKPKFSYPKKSRKRKFQTQKNSSIIPVTWNPEYPPLGTSPCSIYPQTLDEPVCIMCFFKYRKMWFFNSLLIACQTHLFVNGHCSLLFHSLLDCNNSKV